MGPRQERANEAARRQRAESNNTLNKFLGGSARRYSWLNGDVSAVTQRRQAVLSLTPAPSQILETGAFSTVGSEADSSTSAPPALADNTVVDRRLSRTTSSSTGPPRATLPASAHVPDAAATPEPPAHRQSSGRGACPSDTLAKRKEADDHVQVVPPAKRLSINTSTSSSVNTLVQGEVPRASQTPHTNQHWPSTSQPTSAVVTEQSQPLHQDSSPAAVQSGWQQGSFTPVPHYNGQQTELPSRNEVPVETYTSTGSPLNTSAQCMQSIPTTAGSPSSTSPAVQSPTLASLVAGWYSLTQSQRGPRSGHMSPNEAPLQPILPRPLLPVILPYSRVNCASCLNEYIQFRNLNKLPPLQGLEASRFELLSRAVNEDDSGFLFVHQIVSLCAAGFENIPTVLRTHPGFTECMLLMNNLLAGGQIENPELLEFFGRFPCTLGSLAKEYSESYNILTNYVRTLSNILPTRWAVLKQTCMKRGYPPLATELWEMQIYSPILMDVFFLALLRQLWAGNDEFGRQVHEMAKCLFHQNKGSIYLSLTNGWLSQEMTTRITLLYRRRFSAFAQRVELRRLRRVNSATSLTISSDTIPFAGSQTSVQLPMPQGQNLQHPPHNQPRSNDRNLPQNAVTRDLVDPMVQPAQLNTPLIPPTGTSGQDPVAAGTWQTSALHQAHLRDPRFVDSRLAKPESELLYQFVHGFVLGPSRLGGDLYQKISFVIPENERVAKTVNTDDGQRKLRHLEEGWKQYRLRFVKVGEASAGVENLAEDWTLKATSWPSHYYYQFNGHMLETRRKQHHTKDLPIDITDFVQPGGLENTLEIFMNVAFDHPSISLYAYAVEIVDTWSHKTILENCKRHVILSEDSLGAIKSSLLLRASGNDDDVIIDDAKINITIYDPISQGKICEMPARGKHCKHRECFDLPIFLQSRPRERSGWPSDTDSWKCPICLADVRPQHLVVDGFLKDVRDKLVHEGKSKVRTIVVHSDGSWLPKMEDNISSRRSTPELNGPGLPVGAPNLPFNSSSPLNKSDPKSSADGSATEPRLSALKKRAVVIDLCDD
ncbi:uncharacterized protein PV09_00737 [Verruconis gallopava]|uniref:SP-RING-type domain-containing protein n=1 Tax=Verruconis gallopava TaxID=253628 RepID=A0A0D2AQ30_9PEZI|nr:uncharacterized protein PV09_00737 [Verruconis gallopava]KIW08803.1 hypothetical protein PV09_00737 [Verruconis gallopava]